MGIFDTLKTGGRNIWNTVKKPLSGLWSGIKSVDSIISNPLVETGLAISQPELSPFIAGYDIAKWGLKNLNVEDSIDDVLS